MTHNTDVSTLARWMAGDFSNQAQAFENPPFFAHIRVCMRPISIELNSGISLYLEQAYDYSLMNPYRVRVLNLVPQENYISLRNYKLNNTESFEVAARDPESLKQLSIDDLELMEGCNMIVEWHDNRFIGTIEPGKACLVVRNGKTTYLDNKFEIDAQRLVSYDRGRDPETDELAWGSIAGPFEFEQRESFGDEVGDAI